MKITTEYYDVQNFILNRIDKIYIGFNDNIDVKLTNITEYDINLNNECSSTIEFSNVFTNIELANHFRSNSRIIYVRIEAFGIIADKNNYGKHTAVFYDIPCNMVISRLRISRNSDDCSEMYVELEGLVK